jgi:hypothetical protein
MPKALLHQETVVTESEQTQALAKQVPTWVEKAKTCRITTVAQQAVAQRTLLELKTTVKEAKSWFKSLKTPIDAVKALILKKEHEVVDPLESALAIIETEIQRFDRAQQAEALRLQREQEATERTRLEAAKAADLAALKAELAKAKPIEKVELKAIIAEVAAEAIVVAPVIVVPRVAVTPGLTARVTWSAEVIDVKAFHRGLVAGTIPWDAVSINQTFLNQQAREKRAAGDLYPGVQCRPDTTLVGRR